MGPGLPPLSLTAGPSVSEASGGFGSAGTGAFNFKPQRGLIETALPWLAVGVITWLMLRD
ncbi:hypothetical protein [Rhodophyticola sp.]|uniref:hypothetical protein n=1 Tax=Rhodophyticola sp. TaxID=2680032 RepID=UPI003D2BC347